MLNRREEIIGPVQNREWDPVRDRFAAPRKGSVLHIVMEDGSSHTVEVVNNDYGQPCVDIGNSRFALTNGYPSGVKKVYVIEEGDAFFERPEGDSNAASFSASLMSYASATRRAAAAEIKESPVARLNTLLDQCEFKYVPSSSSRLNGTYAEHKFETSYKDECLFPSEELMELLAEVFGIPNVESWKKTFGEREFILGTSETIDVVRKLAQLNALQNVLSLNNPGQCYVSFKFESTIWAGDKHDRFRLLIVECP